MKLKDDEVAVQVAVKRALWCRVKSASGLHDIPIKDVVDKALEDLMVSWMVPKIPPKKST